jgi:RNA polymerase sigma-70 factor (ECF subfamily)
MKLYGSQTTPSKVLARKEMIAQVREALDQLDPLDRQIVLLRSDSGLPYKVIGQMLDPEMIENAVTQRYLRALKKLGKLLPRADSLD